MKLNRELLVHIFAISVIILGSFMLSLKLPSSNSEKYEEVVVTKIIDGDTIIVEGGRKVRLLGIDADERGYPCYDDAKNRLEELVLGNNVTLKKFSVDKDIYGRDLRYIFFDSKNINLQLVREGLAIARFSEDIEFKDVIQKAEKKAMKNNVGCKWRNRNRWIDKESNFTDPCGAEKFEGEEITVEGEVMDFYRSQSDNVFINFGGEYPHHCFTAVIFSHSMNKFDIQLNDLEGQVVKINGTVEMFENKPEIIIENESQIEIMN
ncbi:MAG: thermonuclease family protein [Candidatus Aenigmatarchaeota archaeon]